MSDHVPDEQPRHEPGQQRPQPGQPPNDGPVPHSGAHSDRPSRESGAGDEVAEVAVPVPRSPLDDLPTIVVPAREQHDDSQPENGLVEPDFQYDQTWKRGKRRRYKGYVERVGGAEREHLRESLAAVIRDLLDWASRHTKGQQTDTQSTHDTPSAAERDGDEESGKDSDKDGEVR